MNNEVTVIKLRTKASTLTQVPINGTTFRILEFFDITANVSILTVEIFYSSGKLSF